MTSHKKKPVVFLICPGLGRINRGYESFTRECFDSLKHSNAFNLQLIKGGGNSSSNETVLPNFPRNGTLAKRLAKLLHKNGYYIEQVSFLLALLPLIIIKKPALIIYSDFMTGSYLWHIRKRLKFSYKLLFVNGAPNGPPYNTEDHVQQLLPVYYSTAIQSGEPASKHTLLPYAFDIDIDDRKECMRNRQAIRTALGFLPHQKIVLSVGAVKTYHKRMDHVINEIALLNNDFFLVILGQFDAETPALLELAEAKLQGRYMIKNLPAHEVHDYYAAADYFVLASLNEGFPRVSIEALSFGLPCIVHDYIVMRQILQQYGTYIDMLSDGSLADCLNNIQHTPQDKESVIQFAYNLYAWQTLTPAYENMIVQVLHS